MQRNQSTRSVSWNDVRDQIISNDEVQRESRTLALANVVIALRASRSYTQRQLAEATGLKQSQIARIESGRQRPKLETLGRIASALGFHMDVQVEFTPKDETVTVSTPIAPVHLQVDVRELIGV